VKIICVDNFNREHISDLLVAENVSIFYGEKIVEFLNKTFSGDSAVDYFRLVKDDTKIYKFRP